MIDIISHAPLLMDARDLNSTRKRKSGIIFNEISINQIVPDNLKVESTPKKLLRRFSTKFKSIGTSIKKKSVKCAGNGSTINENNSDEPLQKRSKNIKLCTAITYFTSPYIKKSSYPNDGLSNSSGASHQSSTTRQHIKVGIDLFNWNSNCGVDYFRSNGIVFQDSDLAELFLRKKGFNKKKLCEFLTNTKNRSIHQSFCNSMDLKNKEIVEVLREYLKFSYIHGESVEVLSILEDLSTAYLNQHPAGGVIGLNFEQINTIFLFLVTFKDKGPHWDKKITREQFIRMLQESLTEPLAVNRQLAACLYMEITEAPLIQGTDDKMHQLDIVSKLLLDLPRDFKLLEHHRYVICQVDIVEIVTTDKFGSCHKDRTVFLFNDCLILTKKSRILETHGYRFKRVIPLDDIQCAMMQNNNLQHSTSPTGQIIQLLRVFCGTVVASFEMKLVEDFFNFQSCFEQTLALFNAVTDYKAVYEAKLK